MSLDDGDARPIRKGSLTTPTRFGYAAQVTDTRDGVIVDFELEAAMPPDAPRLASAVARTIEATGQTPRAFTADRGYGQSSVDVEFEELGVSLVAILRKGKISEERRLVETTAEFTELVKWRTGSEGRIATLKRQHGFDRARIRGLTGARIWCGWGVHCHNASKIAALAN